MGGNRNLTPPLKAFEESPLGGDGHSRGWILKPEDQFPDESIIRPTFQS
jgi:hypothetical protein